MLSLEGDIMGEWELVYPPSNGMLSGPCGREPFCTEFHLQLLNGEGENGG